MSAADLGQHGIEHLRDELLLGLGQLGHGLDLLLGQLVLRQAVVLAGLGNAQNELLEELSFPKKACPRRGW